MPETLRLERITTDPDWYEPFKIAIGYRVGDLLFYSGQAAINPKGEIVGKGDFDAQVAQIFENLEFVLAAGGSSLRNVVKVVIYVTDMANFDRVMAMRERYFEPPYPADTIVEVRSLALPDLLIEIDVTAVADDAAGDWRARAT